jgi:hypothetical protein
MEAVMHSASDAVLALTTLGLAWRMRRDAAARAGWTSIGLAAALGVLLYGGMESLDPAHAFFSDLAGWVCLPLLAAHGRLRWKWVRAALVLGAVLTKLPIPSLVQQGVGGAAVVALVMEFVRARRWKGVVGALGFALAGLVIGTQGELSGIARLDIYHLVLASSSALMGLALLESQSPVEPAKRSGGHHGHQNAAGG